MSVRTRYKKNELIVLSEGEYSDYGITGLYRCLVNLDLEKLAKKYFNQAPMKYEEERTSVTQPWEINADSSGFGAWLILNRHVEEVTYTEINCGCSSGFEIDFFPHPAR